MRPRRAEHLLKKAKSLVEQLDRCPIPFGPAPDQEALETFDVELAELIENPGVRVGVRILQRPGSHLLVSGSTGSGKSTLLRRLIDGVDAINRDAGRTHHDPGH